MHITCNPTHPKLANTPCLTVYGIKLNNLLSDNHLNPLHHVLLVPKSQQNGSSDQSIENSKDEGSRSCFHRISGIRPDIIIRRNDNRGIFEPESGNTWERWGENRRKQWNNTFWPSGQNVLFHCFLLRSNQVPRTFYFINFISIFTFLCKMTWNYAFFSTGLQASPFFSPLLHDQFIFWMEK